MKRCRIPPLPRRGPKVTLPVLIMLPLPSLNLSLSLSPTLSVCPPTILYNALPLLAVALDLRPPTSQCLYSLSLHPCLRCVLPWMWSRPPPSASLRARYCVRYTRSQCADSGLCWFGWSVGWPLLLKVVYQLASPLAAFPFLFLFFLSSLLKIEKFKFNSCYLKMNFLSLPVSSHSPFPSRSFSCKYKSVVEPAFALCLFTSTR